MTVWARDITLNVPVHDPEHWRSKAVSDVLHDALSFLTGDRWRIEFVRRTRRFTPERPRCFHFPRSCIVMPFSDGLDSYLMAGLLQGSCDGELVRVRLGSKASLRRRPAAQPAYPFASMQWRVSYGKSGSVEASARSRGFRFALLSGIAAFLCKSRRIVLPESGQGALGPSLVPVGQAYADVRNHPLFTARMERLIGALFGHEVHYKFPQLWRTKGQALSAFLKLCRDDANWTDTRSCWQGARRVSVSGGLRQCGICAACLLRRMSVHAAGRCEAPASYVWEDLSAPRFEDGAAAAFRNREPRGALHEYAIAGVLHLDHLAGFLQSTTDAAHLEREVFLLSQSLGLPEQNTRESLERMLRRHGEEWRSFVESLGPHSFVAQWIDRGH